MVVQHNLTAMNSNRQLGITSALQAKSSEKLSSGYKINRAADDAAGLTISEKMRSQVRGLNRASDNAQDGISLIQVAEGALNETHSILQRMNELAIQAANDTNTESDRDAIQKEVDQLTSEIDRIQCTTQFNTQNLLDGSFEDKKLHLGALEGQTIDLKIGNMDAATIGVAGQDLKTQDGAEAAIEDTAADLVAIGRGTLIDPLFGYKVQTGRGAEIVHEISPEQLKNSQLTPGLLEVFSRKDSGGLPPLPGHDSIIHLHTGKFGDEGQ